LSEKNHVKLVASGQCEPIDHQLGHRAMDTLGIRLLTAKQRLNANSVGRQATLCCWASGLWQDKTITAGAINDTWLVQAWMDGGIPSLCVPLTCRAQSCRQSQFWSQQ